jgi:hypothetical protein
MSSDEEDRGANSEGEMCVKRAYRHRLVAAFCSPLPPSPPPPHILRFLVLPLCCLPLQDDYSSDDDEEDSRTNFKGMKKHW